MKKSKAIVLVAVGLVAGLALGSVGVSYAAAGDPATCVGVGAGMRGAGARLIDIVADLTGLTAEDIRAARAEGQSISDIAEANGVATETVVDEALAARKALLDERVADGLITQEQADAAYELMSERVNERVTTEAVGRPAWAGQGRGMGGGACGNWSNQ